MERKERLLINDYIIYQDDELYCFTSDAILLSKFAQVKSGEIMADFCAGSGIVGLHTFALNSQKIKSVAFFEMQTPLFELCQKTIKENNLQDTFCAHNIKVQDVKDEFVGKFSLIVCNPPYQKKDSGFSFEKREIAIAREEIELTLQELIKSISRSLKFKGRVAMVHRADRLCDVVFEMRKNNIEPKRLQFVYSGKNKQPYLMLIEGVKGGKSGLKILQPISN